jgi:hypothetical protein
MCIHPIIRTLIVLPIFLVHYGVTYSMEIGEVISRMKEVYDQSDRLEYSSHYELFNGHTGTDLVESYEGYYYRFGDFTYQKIGGSEFVFGKEFFLQIKHDEKELSLYGPQQPLSSTLDVKKALESCETSTLDVVGDTYVLKLVFQPSSPLPMSEMSLRISKKDFHLEQMDLYYSGGSYQPATGSPESSIQFLHMKITFSDFDQTPKNHSELQDLSHYTQTVNGVLSSGSLYTGYNLKDNRPK